MASGQALALNGGVGTSTLTIKATLPGNGAGYTFNAGTATGAVGVLNVNTGTYALAGDPGDHLGQPDRERQRRRDRHLRRRRGRGRP